MCACVRVSGCIIRDAGREVRLVRASLSGRVSVRAGVRVCVCARLRVRLCVNVSDP